MTDLQAVNLFDFSSGIRNKRANPLDYPSNALWDGQDVDVSDNWLRTRLGSQELTETAIEEGATVERVFQVRFPTAGTAYIVAQTRTNDGSKLWASGDPIPGDGLTFEEIYDLGDDAGTVSCAVLNDRAVLTEGVNHRPLVFIGGLADDGSDWGAFPKQIFGTLDGTNFFDMTSQLCDNDSDTYVELPNIPSTGSVYVCFDVQTTSGVYLGIKTACTAASTMIWERYVGGVWEPIAITDNTSVAGVPLAASGTVTWSPISTDYQSIAEVPGYWLRMRFTLDPEADGSESATLTAYSDIDFPDYKGTIATWNQSSGVQGRFEDSGNNAVAVGTGTSVLVGSRVKFGDVDLVIASISGDGTGTSGVTLSASHADAAVVGIYRVTVALADIKRTITQWSRDGANQGRFCDALGNVVTVGGVSDIQIGATVTFQDASTATITDITSYGAYRLGVTLSADPVSQNITSITHYMRAYPSWYEGQDGSSNSSTAYATSLMTSASSPSPAAVTTSNEVVYEAWKAFDQVSDYNGWVSSSDTGWIQVDLGVSGAKPINKYMLQARRISGATGFPSSWTLLGSNNGVDWTTLDARADVPDPGTANWVTYTFSNVAAYRYYKLNILGHNPGVLSVAEIRLIEAYMVYPSSSSMVVGTTNSVSQLDVSLLSTINGAVVDITTPGGAASYHAISWDNRNTWKAYVGATWRIIAQKDINTWKYLSGNALLPANENTMLCALRQAFGVVTNRMSEADLEGMTVSDFAASGGYEEAYQTMDFAFALVASSNGSPELAGYAIQGEGFEGNSWAVNSQTQLDNVSVQGDITFWRKSPIEYEYGDFWSEGYRVTRVWLWDSREAPAWQPNHVYNVGDRVSFETPVGRFVAQMCEAYGQKTSGSVSPFPPPPYLLQTCFRGVFERISDTVLYTIRAYEGWVIGSSQYHTKAYIGEGSYLSYETYELNWGVLIPDKTYVYVPGIDLQQYTECLITEVTEDYDLPGMWGIPGRSVG